jgi:tetratricopeptide (TPR) repeat protein
LIGKRAVLASCLFAAALLIHSLLIFSFLPRGQLLKYPQAAKAVIENRIHGERLLDFSPLYLQLHISILKIFPDGTNAVLWIHLILTAVSVCLLFQVLQRYFSIPIAVAGAITFLLDRSVIVYTQAFEPEPVLMFLILAFLFFVTGSSYLSHIAAGIALGLAFLARPNFVPMLVVIPLYFYFRRQNTRTFLLSSLACCLPILFALAGLWTRNAIVTGYFSPVFMNPGTTFYEGNNPFSWGTSAMYPPMVNAVSGAHPGEVDYHHEVYRSFARKITGKHLTLPEVNEYWITKSLNFLKDHPLQTIRLFATKLFHFFHDYQWHDLPNAFWNERALRESLVPSVPFAVVSALALFGLWAARRRWKEFLIIYGMFLSQFLVMMMIYVSSRQRASIISLFVFFACAAVSYFCEDRTKLRLLVVILPLALMLFVRSDLMYEETRLWENNRISKIWLDNAYRERSQSNWKAAAELAARALAATPYYLDLCRPSGLSFEPDGFPEAAFHLITSRDYSSQFDRAVLSVEAGRAADADKILNGLLSEGGRIKRDYYQSSDPYYYSARVSLLRNQRESAIENLQTALNRTPGDPWTLALLSILTGDGRYKQQLLRYIDDIDAQFLLGQAALEYGKAEEAVRSFEYVVAMIPEYRPGWIYLAAALGKAGRYAEGSQQYIHAMKLKQDPVMLEQKILKLYEGLLQIDAANPDVLHLSGLVYRQFGYYQHALELQKQAMQIKDSKNIRTQIQELEMLVMGAEH